MNKQITLAALVALTQAVRLHQEKPAQLAQVPAGAVLVSELAACFDMVTEPTNGDWSATMQRCQRDALARDWDVASNLTRNEFLTLVSELRAAVPDGAAPTAFEQMFQDFTVYLTRQHFRRERRAQPDDVAL